MMEIKPILPEEFVSKLQTNVNTSDVDFQSYFKPYIDMAINYAIGPYFWYIPDNRLMKIIAVSDNIRQLTPFKQVEWIGKGPNFLAQNIHPDDSLFVLSATTIGAEFHESLSPEKRIKTRVNIYCRMLNSKNDYRWTLVQYIANYYNNENRIESTLCMITDLSNFSMIDKPIMTIIDINNKKHQFFKIIDNKKALEAIKLPYITKREHEIVLQMIKGLNTPQIAAALNISYNTVENHKRNLRTKTSTKTSAELIHFVMSNNIL